MTAQLTTSLPKPERAYSGAEETRRHPPPPERPAPNSFRSPQSSHSLRRKASLLRPLGRSAVGLRPSLDPAAGTGVSRQGPGRPTTPRKVTNQPRSFRNDLRERIPTRGGAVGGQCQRPSAAAHPARPGPASARVRARGPSPASDHDPDRRQGIRLSQRVFRTAATTYHRLHRPSRHLRQGHRRPAGSSNNLLPCCTSTVGWPFDGNDAPTSITDSPTSLQ